MDFISIFWVGQNPENFYFSFFLKFRLETERENRRSFLSMYVLIHVDSADSVANESERRTSKGIFLRKDFFAEDVGSTPAAGPIFLFSLFIHIYEKIKSSLVFWFSLSFTKFWFFFSSLIWMRFKFWIRVFFELVIIGLKIPSNLFLFFTLRTFIEFLIPLIFSKFPPLFLLFLIQYRLIES